MFASNPFGQSSSPFSSQSVFEQTSSANSNPFASKPFASTIPFGSKRGDSIFGGTATGVFGVNQSSSQLGSETTFGASSSPAFGSSMPAFGSPLSCSSSGGSSVFGQKPAFGDFASTPTQTSPFGSTFQQSQPAFGSSLFGSTTSASGGSSQPASGASSQPAFGAASIPAFGQTSTPAFGATSAPAFGATSTPAFSATSAPAFGATSAPAFGSTASSTFGSSGTTFGTSSPAFRTAGVFGISSTPVFGSSSTPAFGNPVASSFGGTSTPVFGASRTPAFGESNSPSFNFGSTTATGSTSTFNSSPFGNTALSFGNSSASGSVGNTNIGQSAFGGQHGGSRIAAYTPTTEVDSNTSAKPTGKLGTLSAMPVYIGKSHEELRWEDYQLGDKGGPAPVGQSANGISFAMQNTQSNPFGSNSSFPRSSANPFSTTISSNPFASKTPGFNTSPFSTSSSGFSSSAFSTTPTSNPFMRPTSSATPPGFGSTSTPSILNASSTFGSSPSVFNSTSAVLSASPSLNFPNSQSTSLFQSNPPNFGNTGSAFGQTTASQTATPYSQSGLFNTPSANLFTSSSSMLASSSKANFGQPTAPVSTPSQLAQQPQTRGFSFSNFVRTQTTGINSLNGMSSNLLQNSLGQSSALQSSAIVQPAAPTNPFGTLPARPEVSIGRAGTAPSVQYGISSIPVADKPAPVRITSLLTSRHLSQRRIRLPARKYHPKSDGPKVPFFSDDEDAPSTPKAGTILFPRENPSALVIRPMERWPLKGSAEKTTPLKDSSAPVHENGHVVENGHIKEQARPTKPIEKQTEVHDDHPMQKEDSYVTLTGSRAGEAAVVYEHGADIEALMPKLRRSDYYTEPRIQELAAKERVEPGFCCHVKDFVVGRHGFGGIKFTGEKMCGILISSRSSSSMIER